MAASRSSKPLVSRRRRARRDSEDEDSITMVEDSQSEGSVQSEGDEADADGSDLSETEATETRHEDAVGSLADGNDKEPVSGSKKSKKAEKPAQSGETQATLEQQTPFTPSVDTEAMLNGLEISEDKDHETAIDFEKMGAGTEQDLKPTNTPTLQQQDQAMQGKPENIIDRRRREHEEYKKKRDSDPTFIPNRGNFFMHDARAPDQRGFTSYGRGRGRGRGFIGGPFSPAVQNQPDDKTANAPWAHDLHDTLGEPANKFSHSTIARKQGSLPIINPEPAMKPLAAGAPRPLNSSSSKLLGNVQIRVFLPTMKSATSFSAVPFKQHTRLPDHRPPLRRDKPVRVSLPDKIPLYIFPSQERSFVFIPRALRPNQQGFGRARGSFGYGGPSSRRTSAYGGSIYSPSVAPSRRSSLAQDVAREAMFSPTGSMARGMPGNGRAVVRLPQGMPQQSSPAGSAMGGAAQNYPLPQTPAIEHYRETAMMHQPRPQKAISVSGIESPAGLSLHAPQQQNQQPFENQLPQHMGEGSQSSGVDGAPPSYYSYHGQISSGTPLSNIPERAIHAQPFQPPNAAYGQGYYAQYPQGYYYPPVNQHFQQMPVFVPPPGAQAQGQAAPANDGAVQSTAGLVPHESNGMVYYIDPGQVGQYPAGQETFLQAPSYAMPGMGGMMTPSPDGGFYYPQVAGGPMYYPQTQ